MSGAPRADRTTTRWSSPISSLGQPAARPATPWRYRCQVEWIARFNSDWSGYREDLADYPVLDVNAVVGPIDGFPATAVVSVGAYSLSIYTLGR